MIEEPNEFGVFLAPDDEGPHPRVLVLGGSEGGIPRDLAAVLVNGGFACLAFGYHGYEGVPAALQEIPLERVREAIVWLGAPTGVIGASKGGELALLIASLFGGLVGPVVAYTPSSVVWQGLDLANWSPRSSWSLDGVPLPFVPFAQVPPTFSERGMAIAPVYEKGLDDKEHVREATIEVERATGPLLLISGGDDHMWPATRMCQMVVERMRAHGRGDDVRHVDFPDAGHILFPYDTSRIPTDGPKTDLGGSPEAGRKAFAEVWPIVLEHLTTKT